MPFDPRMIVPQPITSRGAPQAREEPSRLPKTGKGNPPETQEGIDPHRVAIPSPHCAVRGCVYPAAEGDPTRCVYHRRESNEPGMFETLQPSSLMMGRAIFGLPDTEPDDSRRRARRQREKHGEHFGREDAA